MWVFGEVADLRWVLDRSTMATAPAAAPHLREMSAGDRAILYVTRGALPQPDPRHRSARRGGHRERHAPRRRSVQIAGREFTWQVPFTLEIPLPERTRPTVQPLFDHLSSVHNRSAWGHYCRKSPKSITAEDFAALADSVHIFTARLSRT